MFFSLPVVCIKDQSGGGRGALNDLLGFLMLFDVVCVRASACLLLGGCDYSKHSSFL